LASRLEGKKRCVRSPSRFAVTRYLILPWLMTFLIFNGR
jgi:sorbitol-specific phosphotransferase system component IIC